MEDIPIIDHRELCREFETDRHARELLAMAFEALSGANSLDPPDINSVQIAPAKRRELLLQEDNR